MTRFFLRLRAAPLACFALLGSPTPVSAEQRGAQSPVIGVWRGGTVDSVSELYVLDDQSYCFTLMAGSLDLLSAGRWAKAGNEFRFTEAKQAMPLFPMAARTSENSAKPSTITIDGTSLSFANEPFIGFLKKREGPLTLRRLFASDKSSWAAAYTLPATITKDARYLVIADLVAEESEVTPDADRKSPLYIYELADEGMEYRLGYDQRQAMPRIDFTSAISGDSLVAEGLGRMHRSQTKLTPQIIESVRANCITPRLSPIADKPQHQNARGIKRLVPIEMPIRSATFDDNPIFPDDAPETETAVAADDPPLPRRYIPTTKPVPNPQSATTEMTGELQAVPRAPLPAPTPSPGVERYEQRFGDILKMKSGGKRVIAYDKLWKELITNRADDKREVAARAAINQSNDLNALGRYREAITVSNDAYAELIKSPNPELRSRAASLLNNQSTAWEAVKRPDQQEEIWRRILTDFADDQYPTTVYVRASIFLNRVDREIVMGRRAQAVAMLDAFERDYIASGLLAQRPEDAFGINCDTGKVGLKTAVPCMASNQPDIAYFKRYVAAYREKLGMVK